MAKNNLLYSVILPMAMLAATATVAHEDSLAHNFKNISPFVGFDIGRSRVEMQKCFGEKVFRKSVTFHNLFGGLDFSEYFGVELGYQRDNTRRDRQALVAGDFVPGDAPIQEFASPAIYNTSFSFNQKYLGITAKHNILENVSISLLVGVARVKINADTTELSRAGLVFTRFFTAEELLDAAIHRTYSQTKSVPMLRLGISYKLNEHFSFRANTTWMQTAKIMINSDQNGSFSYIVFNRTVDNNSIRLKNSFRHSVGVVAYLL